MMMTGRWETNPRNLMGAALAIALLGIMVTDYEGEGRFVVQLPWPGASTPSGAAPGGAAPARPPQPAQVPRPALSRAGRDESGKGCATIRERLATALRRYRAETRKAMVSLDIFALLATKAIDELPACPSGGAYRLASPGDSTVACTLHP